MESDATAPTTPLAAFCRALPKAELHAHLSGCVRPATLAELLAAADGGADAGAAAAVRAALASAAPSGARSLSDCFRVFALVHRALRDAAAVRRVTREAIHDAARDGVAYLELRTTPRPLTASPADGAAGASSLAAYVDAVVGEIAAVEAHCGLGVVVRLLLSVDRATATPAVAAETVELATRYARERVRVAAATACAECGRGGGAPAPSPSPPAPPPASWGGPYVVGLDLSGDPTRGDAAALLPVLQRAREPAAGGLRVSVHCGEVMNAIETAAVLDWAPDRLGHMCLLSPPTVERLLAAPPARRTPIEVCPASNALTLRLPSLHHHPTLQPWLRAGYPLVLCTDDPGVFGVSLSGEYADVAAACGLSRRQLAALALAGFQHAFADAATKAALMAGAAAAIGGLLAAEAAAGRGVDDDEHAT